MNGVEGGDDDWGGGCDGDVAERRGEDGVEVEEEERDSDEEEKQDSSTEFGMKEKSVGGRKKEEADRKVRWTSE